MYTCMYFIQIKAKFESSVVWGESQIDRGVSNAAKPCAKPQCSGFPQCCTTSSFYGPSTSYRFV